ncbi:MAG: haloacid dehalogenase type II [Thermoleophilaceae bacterium]
MEEPAGIAFDAFGTLFDLDALAPLLGDAFDGFTSRLVPWTWLVTAAGSYRPLPEVAEAAARAAGAGEEQVEATLAGLRRLPLKDDVLTGLDALAGRRLAVLSNGTTDGIEALVANAGLSGRFEHLLAADQVKRYKPAPELYGLAARAFDAPLEQVLLVSGNDWDVAGGRLAGMTTAWLARGRELAPVLGVEPHIVVQTLPELAETIEREAT